ncbi:winged helix-turn-helix domain-containing protein [Streptomyces prunicolor]|uniref:AfsR/SARP family transcriptional regulator n=1 Tax=Streptomyces prunicolor TaxID=67348 RepID=UPI00386DDB5C|nr:winged helix-turn-helix domain-containing protein [Streptomyces prunicolor]
MLFRVLGPLGIEKSNGESVKPWAPKNRALLGYLCLNNMTAVPQERLINAIWSGTPPRSAHAALHVYICNLRSRFRELGLDASVLTTQSTGYELRLPHSSLDLNLFEAHLAQARNLQSGGEFEAASVALGAAVALWRGPALADFRELPAFAGICRLLDEKHVYAYERRLQLELDLGRHRELICELYSLIERYPGWEAVYGYLMISLYRSGRTADALRTFDRVRWMLVEELGIEPGPQLQHIQQSILTRDSWVESGADRGVVGAQFSLR